mgnify:CR=1 FL=1
MKKTYGSMLRKAFLIWALVSLTGCTSESHDQPVTSTQVLAPTQAASSYPLENPPDGQPLEPITSANAQNLVRLAGFSEGGLEDQFALSPDGAWLAVAASRGVVLYNALNGNELNFFQTNNTISSLAFSSDGQKLAYITRVPSGDHYGADDPEMAGQEIFKPQLTLRKMPQGDLLYSSPLFGQDCGEYAARDLSFSDNGKYIFFKDYFGHTGLSKTGSLCVLDAEDGSLVKNIHPETPWRITDYSLDHTDLWIAVVDDLFSDGGTPSQKQLRHYNLENDNVDVQLDLSEIEIFDQSPDKQWLAVGATTLQIRSTIDGSLAAEIQVDENEMKISAATFAADSQILALGYWDGSVSYFSIPQGQFLRKTNPPSISTILAENESIHVVDLQYSPDGTILYILLNSYFAETLEIVQAINPSEGSELFRISGRNTVDRYPSLSPDNNLLAWGGYEDGSAQVWSITEQEQLFRLQGHTQTVLQTTFSPDGLQLATASLDGRINLWDLQDGSIRASFEAHNGGIWTIGYSKDGRFLASVGMDGLLKLWDPFDEKMIKSLETGTNGWQVNFIQISSEDRFTIIGSGCLYPLNCLARGNGDLRQIDLENGDITVLLDQAVIDFSSASSQSDIGLFGYGGAQYGRLDNGLVQVQQTLTSPFGNGGLYGGAISPEGSIFITGNSFGIHGWDVKSGQMILFVQDQSHNGNYGTFRFSDDGCILIVSSVDGGITLWGIPSQ